MEIVVHTPHGDADVSIIAHSAETTLGDVIAAVTGQAVPRLAVVDDRTVDATTPLDEVGLVLGAVVATEPTLPGSGSGSGVALVQVAGHGAGRMVPLVAGSYRVGPGRRSAADELDLAPVETQAFELIVEPTTSTSRVTVVPGRSDVALGSVPVTGPTPWRDGTLTVGPRAFRLEATTGPHRGRTLPPPELDGTVAYSRPPRHPTTIERRPVVDAVRDATEASPTLWERRPEHPDAYVVPIGVQSAGTTTIDVDLRANRAIALAGSERFRSALARSLFVEAATMHGPADLDVVVLTDPGRLSAWEWAKWLPHVRSDGHPAIFATRRDIGRWTEQCAAPTSSSETTQLTMVVLDDPGLWNRRDSPLRPILANPPDHLRFVALCDDARLAPAVCTAVIAETTGGFARLHSFIGSDDHDGIRPALTEPDVALRVARALAPLADVELPASRPADTTDTVPEFDVFDGVEPAEIQRRWDDDAPPATIVIGHRDGRPVRVPLEADLTVVTGPSMRDAVDVAATVVLGQCIERSPDRLWIVPLVRAARSDWMVPHAADTHDVDAAIEPERLVRRLRAVLDEPDGPERVVVVCDADRTTATDPSWLAALADAADDGLAVVVVTDRPGLAVAGADLVITVERYDEPGGPARRRLARITTGDGDGGEQFLPLQPTATRDEPLELRPYLIGRAPTTLERHLDKRRAQLEDVPNPALVAAAAALRKAADQRDAGPPRERLAVPPPMPTTVELADLFATSPGDGVPLGVEDDPATGGLRTRWWQPGSGSLLLFGSRRSGVDQVLTTIVLGVVDRFPSDEIDLVVVEPSPTRRRALAELDRELRVVAPDAVRDVAAALDAIAAALEPVETGRGTDHTRPRPVLLVTDLVGLRRHHAGEALAARVDEVLVAAAGSSHADVIAYAGELDDAGPFASAATARLVGTSSNRHDLELLGVDRPEILDGVVGRCRSWPDGELVQLALSDETFEQLLAGRSIGDPR